MATGAITRLAVFGNPVAHSLSPAIHSAFARQHGLEIDYQAIEASDDSFPDKVAELAARGGRGCNVTAPFKHAALELAARCSEDARRAQAANTLVFEGPGDWYADSTDGRGLVNDLQSSPSMRIAGGRICLLGAGGAAASVLAALLAGQPQTIVIANRSQDRARLLAASHSDLGSITACVPGELENEAPFDLVINATSLGHGGRAPELSPGWFNDGALCYDMNYGKAAKPLCELCRDLGILYSDGLGMLVEQAALSYELWTGQAPDAASVLQTLRNTPG